MVIAQIIGGLGNQMFQYAAGRALSLKNDTTPALDIYGFENYGLHQGFELQRVFSHPFEIASKADVSRVLGWRSPAIIRWIVSRPGIAAFRRRGFVVEPRFHYWPEINRAPKDCYLVGYWQSEKYFQTHTSEIRADFTFKPPLSDRNAKLAEQIAQVNAVSLHVRRGDYVNNAKTKAAHGVCSLDYYRAAFSMFPIGLLAHISSSSRTISLG